MHLPTLLTIDEDTNKFKRLQEENDALRQILSELTKGESLVDVNSGSTPQQLPIMDDFYIIAQFVLQLLQYYFKCKFKKIYF